VQQKVKGRLQALLLTFFSDQPNSEARWFERLIKLHSQNCVSD